MGQQCIKTASAKGASKSSRDLAPYEADDFVYRAPWSCPPYDRPSTAAPTNTATNNSNSNGGGRGGGSGGFRETVLVSTRLQVSYCKLPVQPRLESHWSDEPRRSHHRRRRRRHHHQQQQQQQQQQQLPTHYNHHHHQQQKQQQQQQHLHRRRHQHQCHLDDYDARGDKRYCHHHPPHHHHHRHHHHHQPPQKTDRKFFKATEDSGFVDGNSDVEEATQNESETTKRRVTTGCYSRNDNDKNINDEHNSNKDNNNNNNNNKCKQWRYQAIDDDCGGDDHHHHHNAYKCPGFDYGRSWRLQAAFQQPQHRHLNPHQHHHHHHHQQQQQQQQQQQHNHLNHHHHQLLRCCQGGKPRPPTGNCLPRESLIRDQKLMDSFSSPSSPSSSSSFSSFSSSSSSPAAGDRHNGVREKSSRTWRLEYARREDKTLDPGRTQPIRGDVRHSRRELQRMIMESFIVNNVKFSSSHGL